MKELSLVEAAACLSRGEAVVLPTDTVYGVGVAVEATSGPQRLFEAKQRPADKPVAWLVASADDLERYGAGVPAYARQLAEAFWPGALTLVVRASAAVPRAFQSQAGTIGLRMPASPDALALIQAVGCPLAVTSANCSGAPAVVLFEDLDPVLVEATAGVFVPVSADNGQRGDGVSLARAAEAPRDPAARNYATEKGKAAEAASTVLDCTVDAPRLLRAGALSFDLVKGALL